VKKHCVELLENDGIEIACLVNPPTYVTLYHPGCRVSKAYSEVAADLHAVPWQVQTLTVFRIYSVTIWTS